MKRSVVFALPLTLLLSSCMIYGGGAAGTGAVSGALLGSAIGGLVGGPRGHNIGTLVGSLGGLALGAAIESSRQREVMEQAARVHDNAEVTRRQISDNDRQPESTQSVRDEVYTPVTIRNLQLVDDNGDHVFNRGETCTLIFEVRNNAPETIHNIQLQLSELSENKHLIYSQLPLIETMKSRQILRITMYIKADNRLKNGEAHFTIMGSIDGGEAATLIEFTAPTKK